MEQLRLKSCNDDITREAESESEPEAFLVCHCHRSSSTDLALNGIDNGSRDNLQRLYVLCSVFDKMLN